MTPAETLAEAARNLVEGYMTHKMPAFVLYVTPDGNVQLIGPSLTPDLVGRMLHTAADAYVAQGKTHTKH